MRVNPSAAVVTALACLSGAPVSAATCHMTVLGAPVLDDVPCTPVGRRDDRRLLLDGGGVVTIRRSLMSARLPGRPRPDGSTSGRFFTRSFGPVVASFGSPAEEQTCYFNQKATLCVDP